VDRPIVQIVAHETGEFILNVRDDYAAVHKLLGGMSAKLELGVFLSHDAMLAR